MSGTSVVLQLVGNVIGYYFGGYYGAAIGGCEGSVHLGRATRPMVVIECADGTRDEKGEE